MPLGVLPPFQPYVTIQTGAGPLLDSRRDWTLLVVEPAVPGAITVNLPPGPVRGDIVTVKDGLGIAGAFPITVQGNGHTIDSAPSTTIAVDFGAVDLQYDGVQWVAISGFGVGGGGTLFSPKYLVGYDAPGSDTAASFSALGFTYIADPGDGTGIEAALAAAAAKPGDVHIRPGVYDFSAGAVVAPLSVPPGIVVSGAGDCTVLRARATGDQGVFVLPPGVAGAPSGSSIRDLRIEVPAAAGAGTGSTAAVAVNGAAVTLSDLSLDLATDAASTMRNAILVAMLGNALAPPAFENLSISLLNSTLATSSATSGVRIEEGQVKADNVYVTGGDVGFELACNGGSGGCILYGRAIYALSFEQYGVWLTQPLAFGAYTELSISDSILAPSGNVPPLGAGTSAAFQLDGGFTSSIRSSVIIGPSYGVNTAPIAGVTATVEIADCSFALCPTAVRFGPRTWNSAIKGCTLGADFFVAANTSNFGVLLDGALGDELRAITIANSIFRISDGSALGSTYGVKAVHVQGLFLDHNDIVQLSVGVVEPAVDLDTCVRCSLTGNSIVTSSQTGAIVVEATSTHTTITGNNLRAIDASVESLVKVLGSKTTLTSNTMNHAVSTTAFATVVLDGATRTTVIGNTIEPSSTATGPAISIDGGSQNTCSNNVCSFANPPGPISAIQIGASVGSDNNVLLGNVCRSVPPVQVVAGVGNEVAHNI